MTACPEPDVLGQFVDDSLVADQRPPVEEHIDGCDDCRATVSMLARAAAVERASQPVLDGTELSPSLGLAATAVQTVVDPGGGKRAGRPPESPLAPGTRVGRYVIGKTLGVGGMGIVYTARDPDLGRDVAIKVMRPEFARAHGDATRRIIREAQAMARVAHPNVVSVFDVGTVDDRVFVAMERVSGRSLRDWLADAPHTPAEILEIFTAAGRGLIAAHDAGMVHRDFKPDNVLVGDDGRPRVTDFGLAYDQTDPDGEGDRPVVGTPAYMALEQHTGGNLDARTDQFSFAVALYEALYGKRPFAATTREALADAIASGRIEPPPPGTRVQSSLRAILIRALSARPGDRFPTMAELLKALGRDRARRPRQVALAASIGLLVVGVAFVADLVTRERVAAITRTSFAGTRAQLEKLVALRTETFVAQSDALYRLPAVEEVASSRDLVDFGLGDAADDRRRLEHIHDNLSSADWAAELRLS
jgi:eukaryotic-like serine/threonine-protein kinase